MRRRPPPSPDDEAYEEPVLNLTPLIDVVFVVLITFMLIAPVLDIDLVELASGGASHSRQPQNNSLVISLRADNTIWLHGKRVTLSELEKAMRQEKARSPKQTPSLAADKTAYFGTYQAIKNTLEICGFEQMDVLLKPE